MVATCIRLGHLGFDHSTSTQVWQNTNVVRQTLGAPHTGRGFLRHDQEKRRFTLNPFHRLLCDTRQRCMSINTEACIIKLTLELYEYSTLGITRMPHFGVLLTVSCLVFDRYKMMDPLMLQRIHLQEIFQWQSDPFSNGEQKVASIFHYQQRPRCHRKTNQKIVERGPDESS
jgi:hypothetical protein